MNQLVPQQRSALRTVVVAVLAVCVALLGLPSAFAAAPRGKVTSGTLTWGVKESFRSYMTGFIANGKITASDKAQLDAKNVATFVEASGRVVDGRPEVSYKGKVHYWGHEGELDFTLSDPKLTLDPKGTGHLEFGYQVGTGQVKRIVMADVDPASLTTAGSKASVTNAATTLTKAGMEIFSYKGNPFYPEKTKLDPVSTSLDLDTSVKPTPSAPAPTTPPTTAPSTPTPATSSPGSPATKPTSPTSKPSPSTSSKPVPSKPTPTKPAPATPAPTTGSASLTWGIKASFRSYIASPISEGGRVTVSQHATASGAGFTFPQKATTAKPPSASGTTTYSGAVNFYGHGGALDITFSNPRVVIPASGSGGQIVVDFAQNGKSRGSVPLATLNLAAGNKSTNGSSVTYRDVPTALTQEGVAVFSYEGRGFYPAGIALDPATFTIGANAKVSGSGSSSIVTGTVGSPIATTTTGTGNPAAPGAGASSGVGAATTAPAPATNNAGAGTLVWGVRSSFRTYILGPIAHGSITVGGGASSMGGAWAFPQNGAKTSDGGAPYRGSVKFYGHAGILNLTFADPSVRITSPTSAVLSVSVNGARSDMVTLDLDRASRTTNGGSTTYTGAPATLTSAGAQVFSYKGHAFYPPGSAMDPVTFTVGSPSKATGAESTVSSSSTGLPGGVSADGTGTSSNPNAPGATASGSPRVTLPDTTCPTEGTNLTWGFKESFRSYIRSSITNGDWTTMGGATYKTPTFTWPKGSGRFGKDGRQGTVTYAGDVHFTGHEGVLDTTISNPTIEMAGDKAYLRLDVKSTLMDAALQGKTQWYTRKDVRFVELDASHVGVTKQGDKSVITGTNVPTKLTADGSSAFPNYTDGTAMDPVSFTITTGANCATAKKAAPTKDAKTDAAKKPQAPEPLAQPVAMKSDSGSNSALPWIGGGALGLLGIGTGSVIARRRTPGAHAAAGSSADLADMMNDSTHGEHGA